MTSQIIIGVRCHYCTRFRSPLEIIHMPGGVKICQPCEHRHTEALEALASGRFTGECSECGLSHEEIRAQRKCGPNGEMAIHFENGRYRAMCIECDRVYVPKRLEMYGQTEFGHGLKL